MKIAHSVWVLIITGINILWLDSAAIGSDWPTKLSDPVYQEIANKVDQQRIDQLLKDMTGANPVTVQGSTFLITDRYLPSSKEKFRIYWKDYFNKLSLTVTDLPFVTNHTEIEANGHDVQAILPGQSKDSIVVIVHYDSMGPTNHEADNPAVDDDMTGMAISMETARVLTQYRGRLHYTIRFVASDYEEWEGLEGARYYANYIKNLAATEGFKIISAVDDEQSGWNCTVGNHCKDSSTVPKILVNDCSNDGSYNYVTMGNAFQAAAAQIVTFPVEHECAGIDSDHYAMWEIGVPAIEWGEYSWQTNDHFDASGGDVLSLIDLNYHFQLAKVGVVFAGMLAGVSSMDLTH